MERRTAPRARFTGITILRTGNCEHPCVAGNLSETGILLYPQLLHASASSSSTPLQVMFALPRVRGWVQVAGSIVRESSRNRRREWGVRFEAVPPGIQDALRSYVLGNDIQQTPSLLADLPPPLPPDLSPLPAPLPAARPAVEAPADAAERTEVQQQPGEPARESTRRMTTPEVIAITASGEPTRRSAVSELIATADEPPTRIVATSDELPDEPPTRVAVDGHSPTRIVTPDEAPTDASETPTSTAGQQRFSWLRRHDG